MQRPERLDESGAKSRRGLGTTRRRPGIWRALGVVGSLFVLASASRAAAQPMHLSVDDAVRLARGRNAELELLAAELEAAKARVIGASLLLQDNPIIMLSAGPRSSVAGTSLDFGLQVLQPIEIGGQRSARVDASEAALRSTQAQLSAARARVTARVRTQFGRTLAMARRRELADEALTIAKDVEIAAEERFESGAAPLLEVNTARVELGRAIRYRAEAERAQLQSLAELRFSIGLDPSADIVTTGELSAADVAELGTPAGSIQRALLARAELQESRAALEAAKADERLASRESVPTPSIGASYSREDESRASIVQGIVSIELPLFNRNPGPRGVTAARVRRARAALEARERQIKEEVLASLARVRAAREAAAGYAAEVVKAMQENMGLITDSYRAGKIDFSQLVVVRRQAVEAQNEYIDVLEELNAAQAELALSLGSLDGSIDGRNEP